MREKSRLLTIGQFAALHGINKKTLMWYDEIGLFHPASVSPENGYRYYSYYQSSLLETILLLREMDVSTEEIRTFMGSRSEESLERLLEEKIRELDEQISHWKSVRKTLDNHRRNLRTLRTMDLSEIRTIEREARQLVTVDIGPDVSFDKQVEMITGETKKYQLRRLRDASYGVMIPVEKLYEGDFDGYTKLFIEIPFPIKKAGLHTQPGGRCLRAFYKGPWNEMSRKYREILDFAARDGLALAGFSYEIVLNEAAAVREEDAIVEIQIPLAP